MLNLSLFFFGSFITFYISLIFLVERLGKLFLILTISLILVEDVWMYNWLFWMFIYLLGFFPLFL